MFKSLAKDLSGSADICKAVTDFRKLEAANFLLPGEQVMFAFQSPKEEWIFTNEAIIALYGDSATTTRRLVERFEYRTYYITNVKFETTGRVDRDCEIKFKANEFDVSIDIARKEENAVKKHYKALLALSREQEHRRRRMEMSNKGLKTSADALLLQNLSLNSEASAESSPLTALASSVLASIQNDYETINPRCYRDVLAAALR
ncbi:hypothetical protein Poli38472_011901 [Pythium oligandrum]|uniref:Bacterial Pleckstrin homology domain-containing protein n=1 Tax=Pythium oligandrum TaxID=41045 RepID=A0A8K1C8T9_PYTOL|nr:hypothetical protein Poli38472_011901 [Pythium oligandrum]|eukprot:TMW58313.1 hypothetical protein Poli38472_011901 [Pythium oligandrum]